MQNYFGPFYFGELKRYNSKYCSNFVLFFGLQLIFAPFNFAVLFGTRNSRNKGHANIKGFTVIKHHNLYGDVVTCAVIQCCFAVYYCGGWPEKPNQAIHD